MSNSYLRLIKVKLQNFKNIANGEVSFAESQALLKGEFELSNSAVLGIYGQNGSGKTGVIEALDILHALALGELPKESGNKVMLGQDHTTLEFTFLYHNDTNSVLFRYSVAFKSFHEVGRIVSETLAIREFDGKKWKKEPTGMPGLLDGQELKKLIEKTAPNSFKGQHTNSASMIFNPTTLEFLRISGYQHMSLIKLLQYELEANLIVINSQDDGTIYLDSCTNLDLPLYVEPSHLKIDLFKKNRFTAAEYALVEQQISKNNLALTKIIPGLSVVSSEVKTKDANGQIHYNVEFFSLRDKQLIALSNESQGIKRLISVVGAIIAAYNNPSVILAVDEFDAGVFEYLLGDILEVFHNDGQGQLIFTSHNLRVLELLKADDVVFTSYASANRYVRLPHVRRNTNLRDAYLRSLFLNEDNLYTPTDQYSISKALRKAGAQDEK